MPLYEYQCQACKKNFELVRGFSERDEPAECPACGAQGKMLRAASKVSAFSKGQFSGDAFGGGAGCGGSGFR